MPPSALPLPEALFRGEFVVLDAAADGPAWTMTAVGDLAPPETFGRCGGAVAAEALAQHVAPLIRADLTLANLEVGLADGAPPPKGVCAPRDGFFRLHAALPFDLYCLANNHICDAGREAFSVTLNAFEARGVGWFGAGRDEADAARWRTLDRHGVRVGIAGFAQDEHQVARGGLPGSAWLNADAVLRTAVAMARSCDVPVMVLHEGFEFMEVPRRSFLALCRELVDAGIRVVIGLHPHVPQGIERRGDGLILFGLGNFFFQAAHFAKYPWARRSFVPRLHFRGARLHGLELQPIVLETNPLLTRPGSAAEAEEILSHLREVTDMLADEQALNTARAAFLRNILMPEFFGWVRALGNANDGDYASVIADFENRETVHKVFREFIDLHSPPGALP